MVDRQALFEQFLNFLDSESAVPEYLGQEPESPSPFDPYQMVAEWIALRHEVKQQGKLLQASQATLQQALNQVQTEKADLQQQLQTGQRQSSVVVDQKALWRDLLSVMDALDQACAHWQEQIESLSQTRQALPKQPTSCWQRWVNRWQRWVRSVFSSGSPQGAVTNSTSLTEILVSHHEGVDLIRRSLLDVLRQRQVIPIEAEGHPFDPQTMYAVGRREMPALRENIVVQEVVRGYLWKGQVLREAQVIVATHTG